MGLAYAEVYEVATFYHHFDVVKEGEQAPPALTVRVCDSLSCELAGAQTLLDKLRKTLGANVRVIPAPCIGRCEQAPAAVVGQNPVANATVERVKAEADKGRTKCAVAKYIGYDEYRKKGGYKIAAECLAGTRDAEDIKRRSGCALADLANPEEVIEVAGVDDRPSRKLSRRALADGGRLLAHFRHQRFDRIRHLFGNRGQAQRAGRLDRLSDAGGFFTCAYRFGFFAHVCFLPYYPSLSHFDDDFDRVVDAFTRLLHDAFGLTVTTDHDGVTIKS